MSPMVIISTLGWIVAALAIGLWWGERGRRIDAQHRETGRPRIPGKPKKATVTPPSSEGSHITEGPTEDELRERLIEDAVADGYPRELAEKDADQVLSQLKTDGPTGGPGW